MFSGNAQMKAQTSCQLRIDIARAAPPPAWTPTAAAIVSGATDTPDSRTCDTSQTAGNTAKTPSSMQLPQGAAL